MIGNSCCLGQSYSIGAIGGVRTTDDLSGYGATSASKRYVVGLSLQIGLPHGFGLEADALYRRQGYQSFSNNFGEANLAQERANSWEFPLLLRYNLPSHFAKPFVALGYGPRILRGSTSYNLAPSQGPATHLKYTDHWPVSNGFVCGGGLQFGTGRLHLSPEVRYTRWIGGGISVDSSHGFAWESGQNQVDLLLSIRWQALK